jgi:hypothetical protein
VANISRSNSADVSYVQGQQILTGRTRAVLANCTSVVYSVSVWVGGVSAGQGASCC